MGFAVDTFCLVSLVARLDWPAIIRSVLGTDSIFCVK